MLRQFALRTRLGPKFKVDKNIVICSKHYRVEDFYCYNPPSGRRQLKPSAFPSIFYFKPTPKSRKPPANRTFPIETFCPKEDSVQGQSFQPRDECSNPAATRPQVSPEPHQSHPLQRDERVNPPSTPPQLVPKPQHQSQPAQTIDDLLSMIEDSRREKKSLMYDVAKERKAWFLAEKVNSALKVSLEKAQRELEIARREVNNLRSCKLTFNSIKGNRSLMKIYTGMESEVEFNALFRFLDPGEYGENIIQWRRSETTNLNALPKTRGRYPKLKAVDQLLLVFCRLRLNLLERALAHRFGVSLSTVSRIFSSWVNFMYFRLGSLQLWPSKEYIKKTMPQEFRKSYPSTRVIIDATELKCENPSSFMLKTGLNSFFKGTHTFKGIIGIAPNGPVTFVSALFSGSISDEEITKRSGILNQVYQHGDGIMADKGFNIEKIMPKGVLLNIPPFEKGNRQFTRSEIQTTQEIASLRVHVERRIARIKSFRILSQVIPQSLASLVNQIWTVCSILTNFHTPLIKQQEEDPLFNVVYFSEEDETDSD